MNQITFSFGDRVQHTDKPEWGDGVVTGVKAGVFEGRPCQTVTVRFDRAGLKTLSTGVAKLTPSNGLSPARAEAHANGSMNWLDQVENDPEVAMLRIPEPARDPFKPLEVRLGETLRLYRFSRSGGSLLDWAASQSGLKDPLSHFNRHELERLFDRFLRDLDAHLQKLTLELKKKNPAALAAVAREAPDAGRAAMRRVTAGR